MMKNFKLKKEDTLLLIIDIQERLVPAMFQGDKVINNNKILITALKEMNIPIIHTEQYPRGLGRTIADLSEILGAEKPLEKIVFSAFNKELKDVLIASGRINILLTGMESHVCVYQTARDLIQNGFNVFLVSDGVTSRTKENYQVGVNLIKDMGGIITSTEVALFDLLEAAGSDEFKMVSKLVK